MVHADDRSCLGQTIPLDDENSDAGPRVLEFARQSGAPGDDGPEFPSQTAMQGTSLPPAFRDSGDPVKVNPDVPGLSIQLEERCYLLEEPGNGDEYGHPLTFEDLDDVGRGQGMCENHRTSEQRRNEQTHDLAEKVAQGEQTKGADRLKGCGQVPIAVEFGLEGAQVGRQALMAMNDAFGVSRGARGEDDLGDVLGPGASGRGRGLAQLGRVWQAQDRNVTGGIGHILSEQDQAAGRLPRDAVHEIDGRSRIDRYDLDSPGEGTPENEDPFGTVLGPEKQAMTRLES